MSLSTALSSTRAGSAPAENHRVLDAQANAASQESLSTSVRGSTLQEHYQMTESGR
jgi:hypothetical protein